MLPSKAVTKEFVPFRTRALAMGIKGLPEVLRPWLTSVQVSKYRGKRAAVDAYSWLHKGAYSCALELGTGERWWARQKRDAPYVRYCVHRAQMLRHFGVTPGQSIKSLRLELSGLGFLGGRVEGFRG